MDKLEELEKQLEQVNKDLKVNKELLITTIENTPIEMLNLNIILGIIDDLIRHKKELLYYINQEKLNNTVLK